MALHAGPLSPGRIDPPLLCMGFHIVTQIAVFARQAACIGSAPASASWPLRSQCPLKNAAPVLPRGNGHAHATRGFSEGPRCVISLAAHLPWNLSNSFGSQARPYPRAVHTRGLPGNRAGAGLPQQIANAPTVGLEPTTTRLRALRSAD